MIVSKLKKNRFDDNAIPDFIFALLQRDRILWQRENNNDNYVVPRQGHRRQRSCFCSFTAQSHHTWNTVSIRLSKLHIFFYHWCLYSSAYTVLLDGNVKFSDGTYGIVDGSKSNSTHMYVSTGFGNRIIPMPPRKDNVSNLLVSKCNIEI